jgi:4-hydroxybenzoate polyprenyltransferase
VTLLLATAVLTEAGPIAFAGIAAVAAILLWEHHIVKPNDMSRVNVAFFNLNGYISILLFLTFATDLLVK